ncbi:MAG: hypothetical protein JSS27_13440 [Planctomycetes bacterium]|nr:hypothetical protein [Planctomycetota bacterium]
MPTKSRTLSTNRRALAYVAPRRGIQCDLFQSSAAPRGDHYSYTASPP